jgi:hypothetical protein
MTIPQDLLELLEMQNPAALAEDAGGKFPLVEIDEALRTGEASSDLVAWLERWREVQFGDEDDEPAAAAAMATERAGATPSRLDAPPGTDPKNYEQGPA